MLRTVVSIISFVSCVEFNMGVLGRVGPRTSILDRELSDTTACDDKV